MSNLPGHNGCMNIKQLIRFGSKTTVTPANRGRKIIATFGLARLVRNADGRHELIGGTASDCIEAREWCSLFAPEIVFSRSPARPGTLVIAA